MKVIILLAGILSLVLAGQVNATERYIMDVTAVQSHESRKMRLVFSVRADDGRAIYILAPYQKDALSNVMWVVRGYSTTTCPEECFEGHTKVKAVMVSYQFKKKFSSKWTDWKTKTIFLRSCIYGNVSKIDYRVKHRTNALFDVTISCEAYLDNVPSMSSGN